MSIIRRHNSEKQQVLLLSQAGIEMSSHNLKKGNAVYKVPATKKQKWVSPYENQLSQEPVVDKNQLLDVPIQSWEGANT